MFLRPFLIGRTIPLLRRFLFKVVSEIPQLPSMKKLYSSITHNQLGGINRQNCKSEFLRQATPLRNIHGSSVHVDGYPGAKEVGDKAGPDYPKSSSAGRIRNEGGIVSHC